MYLGGKNADLVTNYRRRIVIHADMDSTGTLGGTCPPPGWSNNDFLYDNLAGMKVNRSAFGAHVLQQVL